MNTRETGAYYEELAAEYLEKNGVRILEHNFRNRGGEIDLIGYDGSTYLFVEVKYRKNDRAGDPAAAVDQRKQATISRVADYYRSRHGLTEACSFRFDVISILGEEIAWIRDAFPYRRYYR